MSTRNRFGIPGIAILCVIACLSLGTTVFSQSPGESGRLLPGQLLRQTPSGGTIFRCLFDMQADMEDGDGWPDFWTRKRGIDNGVSFPEHLTLEMVEHPSPFSNFALRMNMEGGAAAAYTPKIPIRAGMSYTVSAHVSAENLVFDDVSILLSFYDEKATAPVKTVSSHTIQNTNGWKRLEIGPIVADMPDVRSVSVGLLVLPRGRQDYGATVDFTDVEIRESPSVVLSSPAAHHLFFSPRNIDVACRLHGIDPHQNSIEFRLEDPFGRIIAQKEVEMMFGNLPASQFVLEQTERDEILRASANWQSLPIVSPGFYRVRISTPKSYVENLNLPEGVFFQDPLVDAEPLTFVVMDSATYRPDGEFGWNLDGWSLDEIENRRELLAQSGLSRLKIPAWISDDADGTQRRRLGALCDEWVRQRVRLVGLLRPVPGKVRAEIKHGPVDAGAIFSLEASRWADSVNPTLQTLSLLVRDWQWTADDDPSIADIPGFPDNFDQLRSVFDRNDYGFGVGFAWNWNRELPSRFGKTGNPAAIGRLPNEFVALNSSEPLTSDDLEQYLRIRSASLVRRFVSLTPLSGEDYSLEDRISDLVRRMVVAKAGGAEALFLSQPINRQHGVLRDDITPGELYLPWRTASNLISGNPLIGSVTLPNRSRNFNFDLGNGQALMVLWNDRSSAEAPLSETLYLGENPVVVDVWGKRFTPEFRGREQTIPVGPVPLFVLGIDSDIVRMRNGFKLDTDEIPSFPNRENTISFSMTNETSQAWTAQCSVAAPRPGDWRLSVPESLFLEPGQAKSASFPLTLMSSAETGLRPIRFNVKTVGSQAKEFAIYDEIQIGDKDVFMEFSTRMTRSGEIEVAQSFINDGENEYTFSCRLYIPGRMNQKSYVSRQGFGRVEYVYTIPRGHELIRRGVNELILRAEPVGEGQPMVYTIPLQFE